MISSWRHMISFVCTKVRNTPQPCDDPTHQRTLQETLHTPSPSARWGRDPGITSLYAKTQDCSIFPTPTLMKYHSLLFVALWHRSIFSSIALRNSYYRISIRPPQNILFEPVVEFVFSYFINFGPFQFVNVESIFIICWISQLIC